MDQEIQSKDSCVVSPLKHTSQEGKVNSGAGVLESETGKQRQDWRWQCPGWMTWNLNGPVTRLHTQHTFDFFTLYWVVLFVQYWLLYQIHWLRNTDRLICVFIISVLDWFWNTSLFMCCFITGVLCNAICCISPMKWPNFYFSIDL